MQVCGVSSQSQSSSGWVLKCPTCSLALEPGAQPQRAAGRLTQNEELELEEAAGGMGPAQLSPWGQPQRAALWGAGEGKRVLGRSGSCSALTMDPALHTSRVTALRCCFSRVMAG